MSGHLLEQGSWEHLCLPAEYEPNFIGGLGLAGQTRDRNRESCSGPERFGVEEIATLKRSPGSYASAGQLQQRPSPAEGGILKRHWWRFWKPAGLAAPPVLVRLADGSTFEAPTVELPADVDEQIQSWDCAFKDLETSDYVVGQVWGRLGADCFLVDQVRDKLDCPGTVHAVRKLTQRWPHAVAKLIEDKANGSAVIQMLAHEVPGLLPVNPEGGKAARASAVSPMIEAGNVYLPHPTVAPWVDGFIDECACFPNGKHDDQVDAATQALLRLSFGAQQPMVLIYSDPVLISRY